MLKVINLIKVVKENINLLDIVKKILDRIILIFSWMLLIIGGIISVYFMLSTYSDGFGFYTGTKIDFTTTGQFGDFLGGAVGTVFTLAGTLLIYLSFKEQTRQNKREAFESTFFMMINLHRENVSELNYAKFDGSEFKKSDHRKVFRMIFSEFIECFREVKKFSNSEVADDYLLPEYKQKLIKIIENINPNISIIELVIIYIAYSIVFYGVGEESKPILRGRFKKKYKSTYVNPLLAFIKLKPKRENKEIWDLWSKLRKTKLDDLKRINQEIYDFQKAKPTIKSWEDLSADTKSFVYKDSFPKYYGGHQHRLGHYFRHLFQCYKYLNYNKDLTDAEKYFYGKTLRAQLSTYEQALIFINSISTLGMKWEFKPETELLFKGENKNNSKLITRYNLIKNLPGYHLYGLRYKDYYPDVKYETDE